MTKNTTQQKVRHLVALAMFIAVAYVVHFIHIPVGFLNLDFKDVIITICGMHFGPLSGIAVAAIVPIAETITVSGTGPYGLIMNLLGSVTFVGVASVIYRFKKTLTGAVVGLFSAAISMTAVMIIANLLITPHYMGVSVSEVGALIPTLLLPFNAVKAVLNASLTMCLYKPLTSVLKRTGFSRKVVENEEKHMDEVSKSNAKIRTALVWMLGAAVVLFSFFIIFFVLGGTVEIN